MRRKPLDPEPTGPVLTTLFSLAALAAVALLVFDHYTRISDWLVIASSVLLVGLVFVLAYATMAVRSVREEMAASEAIRAASIESASYCVITFDEAGRILEWNEAATKVFGHSREKAVGTDLFSLLLPPYQTDESRFGFEAVVEGDDEGEVEGYHEIRAIDAAGRVFPIEVSVAKVREEPLLFTAFARSLTRERIKEQENRRLADIVRSSEDAIMSVDLEGRITAWNKGATKLYGYSPDETIGHRLTDLTIPPDRSRELGATFRRVISGASGEVETERRTKSGERLRVSSRAFPVKDVDGQVVGMSLSSRELTAGPGEEVGKADERERTLWRSRIEEALEDSTFVFWGQPVFDSRNGQVNHTELLIRMKLGDDLVQPGEFLPHAENTELIEKIDRWAIAEGIRIGARMPVAINLSGRSLSTPDLGKTIHKALSESGTDPGNLTFEITETAAVENITAARELVTDLNSTGCTVSIDDFGTGYGSFTYVRYLPVAELKIDISFVKDLTSEEASRRVVRSIVSIAQNFGVGTVAEGIEDSATLQLVREMGIDMVQGYYLGRPAPLEAA